MVPLELSPPPMMPFARSIELSNVATVQCLHDPDSGKHRQAASAASVTQCAAACYHSLNGKPAPAAFPESWMDFRGADAGHRGFSSLGELVRKDSDLVDCGRLGQQVTSFCHQSGCDLAVEMGLAACLVIESIENRKR
jgi:hypothetical protein